MIGVKIAVPAVLAAVSLLLGCAPSPQPTNGTLIPSSQPTASAIAAGADQQLCALMPVARKAHDHAAAAVAADAVGNNTTRASEATAADVAATSFLTNYGSLRPNLSPDYSTFGEVTYLQVNNIQVLARALNDPTSDASDLAPIEQLFPFVSQALGQAAAMAYSSTPPHCPGGFPGSPLPTFAPPATNGPVPPGSIADQESSVLKVFSLAKATDVELLGDASFQSMPDGSISLDQLSLKNDSDATIGFAGELSVLRWDGEKWTQLPCQFPASASARGLCATHMTNVQTLLAHATSDPNLSWLGVISGGPGTYALVAPIFRSADDFPATDAAEAAVKIVTATAFRPQ